MQSYELNSLYPTRDTVIQRLLIMFLFTMMCFKTHPNVVWVPIASAKPNGHGSVSHSWHQEYFRRESDYSYRMMDCNVQVLFCRILIASVTCTGHASLDPTPETRNIWWISRWLCRSASLDMLLGEMPFDNIWPNGRTQVEM